jgi:uncharacterized protein (DUF2147 family)
VTFFIIFRTMKASALLFLVCFVACSAQSQPVLLGKWKTFDDTTGNPKSIVELLERNGMIFGRVVKIFTPAGEDPDPVCNECPKDDSRVDKKVIGMEIITDMVKKGDVYSGGEILDPEIGRVYRCKLWLEENTLKVRGYFGPLYRTQTWIKAQ